MADDCCRADPEDSPRISDSRTVHSHIHYAFMRVGFVGVVDEFKLEALSAIST